MVAKWGAPKLLAVLAILTSNREIRNVHAVLRSLQMMGGHAGERSFIVHDENRMSRPF